MRFTELMPFIQTAVGPVILISGVGLVLLSMTNRLGRVIDRARQLGEANRHAEPAASGRLAAQLKTLRRRADLLRLAITLAVVSVLSAALLIMAIFITALIGSDLGMPIALLFLATMLMLILSLVVFLQDLNLSLEAMKTDLE